MIQFLESFLDNRDHLLWNRYVLELQVNQVFYKNTGLLMSKAKVDRHPVEGWNLEE